MKIKKTVTLINVGNFNKTPAFKTIMDHISVAISSIENPPGSGSFTLYPVKKANGVKPIKDAFNQKLEQLGWEREARVDVAVTTKWPGPIDAAYPVGKKYFAAEWETGNISSSHRAINKIVVGILQNVLIGGVVVLPSRKMYQYLTDRVGNFQELEPYFPVWKSANYDIEEGIVQIIEIEHDSESMDVPAIPKGTDGRALR
ncbi:MAG: restriction endonuclease [Peptococcaceae bacterium]|nr:restriction endonuclease [Peptococcaceae bacterium]